MHQKENQKEIVTPKQQQVQKKEQIKSPKDQLKTFTQQTILKMNNIGLYQIFQMPIQQLSKFRDGLQAYYQQETILVAIVKYVINSRIQKSKELQELINQKSIMKPNQLRVWTMKTVNQIVNDLNYSKKLGPVERVNFQFGLRKYFQKEIYLFYMINKMEILSFYNLCLYLEPNRTKYASLQKYLQNKLIQQLVYFPFSIESESEEKLKIIQYVLKKYHLKEIQFQKIISIFLERKKKEQREKKEQNKQVLQIPKTIQKSHDQLEVWTKQFFLFAVQRPFQLQKKDVKLLSKFKVGLERNFDKEISLIKIIQNLINKKTEFSEKKEFSVLSSFKKKLKDGVNQIFSFKIFKNLSKNRIEEQVQYLKQQSGLHEQLENNQ